jgi:hypothetical protein
MQQLPRGMEGDCVSWSDGGRINRYPQLVKKLTVLILLQNTHNFPKHSKPQNYQHKKDDSTSITASRDRAMNQGKQHNSTQASVGTAKPGRKLVQLLLASMPADAR